MNRKCLLSLVFFLGNMASQMTFANTSENSSPMEALVNSSPVKTETPTAAMPTSPTQPLQEAAAPAEMSNSDADLPAPAAIDCTYTIPEGTSPSSVGSDTIIQWASYAATETFTYDFRNYDKQFKQLKECYTTAGWESFLGAMKASNNLKVTQEEHLFVTAKVNGTSQLLSASTAQNTQPTWVVRVPLLVSYQNQDREVTQDMYIDLTIKPNYGVPTRLGINQIIAAPKAADNATPTT